MRELIDHIQMKLQHRYEHQLCDAIQRLDGKGRNAAIPQGHLQFALIIRINQTNEIAQHDAMLGTEAGARQDYRGVSRIANMDRQTARESLNK